MTELLKKLNDDIADISSWLPHDRLPWVIAGPCSAESEEQMLETARVLVKSPHIKVFRAGIWKPRTRPGSFEGVGEEGLNWLDAVKAETGLLTTTEVAGARHVEICLERGVDILWIGARTTVNPFMVQEIAEALKGVDIPVLVKNPINAELGLWLGAIERLYQSGIHKLGAIHRGFSTYTEMEYRNEPNWQIPIELKRLIPRMPLICDPSHISGNRDLVEQVSRMALDLGIESLMVESHIHPEQALSDARQQVTPEALTTMLERLRARHGDIANKRARKKIERLRSEISQLDAQILSDLAERMHCVEEIGRLKQKYEISVLQLGRWENLLEDHIAKARGMGLDADFVKAVFEEIHTYAVRKQL